MDPTPVPAVADATPAAPAAATPETRSARDAAIVANDPSAYREARRAEKLGKHLPDVPLTTEAAPAESDDEPLPPAAATPAPSKPISKRQQQINDYERRIAEATERIRALEAGQSPKPETTTPPAPAPAAQPTQKEYQRLMALPEAPKLKDYDTVEEHAFAVSEFIDRVRSEERATADRQRQDQTAITAAQQVRVEKFVGQLTEARTADPEFVNKLTPEVKDSLKPFGALKPGEASGPINVIGEQVYDSPIAPAVLLHFSQHPEDLKRLTTMPAHLVGLPHAAQLKAHTQWMVKEYSKLEGRLERDAEAVPPPKTISDAPDPAPVLGARPTEAADPKTGAIKRGDVRAYRQLRRAERAQGIGR